MRNCDSCGTELTPVFPELMRRRDDHPQYSDALIIKLVGGYGMLIDPGFVGQNDQVEFILCKDCGTKIVRAISWMHTPETEHLLDNEESS